MMASSEGSIGVDHAWKALLEGTLNETVCPASLGDALCPLTESFPDEIDEAVMKAVVDGQHGIWRNVIYSDNGGFDLPQSYKLDWAVAIYVYSLSDPKVFKVVNREMFSTDCRKSAIRGGVSDGLSACLPYIRFLIDAIKVLPARYVFKGQVRRGVKHVFLSPENHNPEGHFRIGSLLMWYEFKSTSKNQEVMEHFCRVSAGPRTTFVIDVILGYDINKFSFFQGGDSEYEVLLLPMSLFEVVHVAQNIINSTVTASPDDSAEMQRANLELSWFPDVVHLRQVEADQGSDAAATHPPASNDGQTMNITVALVAHPARWQACTNPQTGCTNIHQRTQQLCPRPQAPHPLGRSST
jgi:hypothetical protein